jgi:hypothetical protein
MRPYVSGWSKHILPMSDSGLTCFKCLNDNNVCQFNDQDPTGTATCSVRTKHNVIISLHVRANQTLAMYTDKLIAGFLSVKIAAYALV